MAHGDGFYWFGLREVDMERYKKARENLLVMLFCALLCVCLFIIIIPKFIPVPPAAEKDVFTPRTFPYFLTTIISICTVIGICKSLKVFVLARKEQSLIVHKKTKRDFNAILTACMPYLIFGLIVLYGVGISHFGFIISTLIVPPFVLFLIGGRSWKQYVGVLVFAAIIWVLFRFVLHVQLP